MYSDTPYSHLMAALSEHPKATYTRVERIDLIAILDMLELKDTSEHGDWYDEGYRDGKKDRIPAPADNDNGLCECGHPTDDHVHYCPGTPSKPNCNCTVRI